MKLSAIFAGLAAMAAIPSTFGAPAPVESVEPVTTLDASNANVATDAKKSVCDLAHCFQRVNACHTWCEFDCKRTCCQYTFSQARDCMSCRGLFGCA